MAKDGTKFGYCRWSQFPPGCGAKSQRKLTRVSIARMHRWLCKACLKKLGSGG